MYTKQSLGQWFEDLALLLFPKKFYLEKSNTEIAKLILEFFYYSEEPWSLWLEKKLKKHKSQSLFK